jgi:hypothetical protein
MYAPGERFFTVQVFLGEVFLRRKGNYAKGLAISGVSELSFMGGVAQKKATQLGSLYA